MNDGSEPLLTAAAVVRVLGLEAEDEVDAAQLSADLLRVGHECAHERVLRLLGYRDRTEHELHQRLVDDGYPLSVADPLVERFVELGYVDDARFAAQWTESRRRSGYGPSRIERELRTKGIEASLAASAARVEDDEEVLARARTLVERMDLSDKKSRQKAFARLVRKGFSTSLAARALESADSDR